MLMLAYDYNDRECQNDIKIYNNSHMSHQFLLLMKF